jgi:acetyl esterase/lipase
VVVVSTRLRLLLVALAVAGVAGGVLLAAGAGTGSGDGTAPQPVPTSERQPAAEAPAVEESEDDEPTPEDPPVPVEVTTTPVSYGEDPQQSALVYRRTDIERGPAVVLVHGGCWNSGSIERWDETARVLADDGFVVWAGSYRHHDGDGRWQTQPDDVAALVARVRSDPHVDPDRVVIGGDSSGAHLALLHAYRQRDVAGVLSLSGVIDPEAWVAAGSELSRCFPAFAGGRPADAPPGRYDELSPLRSVGPGVPVTAVVASTADPITPVATQVEPLLAALDEAGAPGEAIVVDECPGNEHVDHGTRLLVCTMPAIRAWLAELLRP